MRTEAGSRGTFGRREAAERPADGQATGDRRGGSGGPDRPASTASPERDLHPRHVRRDHSLSEIF